MSNQNIVKFLQEVGKLKSLDRTGWVIRSIPKPETVAGHMYRMAMIAMLTLNRQLTGDIDMEKVVKMCLVHDMAECIVGDITPHDGVAEEVKHQLEMDAMVKLCKLLPNESSDSLMQLFLEYEERKSPEAKLTKEIDIYDMLQQAYEYECSEYERTGQVPDFSCFFQEKLKVKITHPAMKPLLQELLEQRKTFLSSVRQVPVPRPVKPNYHLNSSAQSSSSSASSPSSSPSSSSSSASQNSIPLNQNIDQTAFESNNLAIA